MAHPCHLRAPAAGFPVGETVLTRAGEPHDTGVELAIVKQAAGDVREDASTTDETAWLLLGGTAAIAAPRLAADSAEQLRATVTRASVFDEGPSVLHVGAGALVRLAATTDVEWLRIRTANAAALPTTLYGPTHVTSEARGKGLAQDASLRCVRLVFDRERAPASQLVVGEVVGLPGRWSSYPPHHHAQPELYHYRFTAPHGYGHAELGDDVVKVRHGDTVKILGGVDHPQCAAPGYGMFYVWIVRHQPNDPYTGFTYDPAHTWLLDAAQQGWRPREPL